MKELKLCLEVNGLARDECDLPAPAGICITLGEVSEEKYASMDYFDTFKNVNIEELLEFFGLNSVLKKDNVKIISPEEYDKKY